jgi:amidase
MLMNSRRSVFRGWIVPGVLLLSGLSGCSTLHKRAETDPLDHAFIAYWPPSKNSRRLRLAVKDLIDMKGVVTTAGSEFLAKNSPPAKRDAKCLTIARQRQDVQFVGKTNTTELAVAVSGINEYFGTPRNPLSSRGKLIPGGSSCGSAVAVAAGMADVAFGTDTAGSIRIPAACCGIVGLKTTFGLVPLDGVYPIAPNHLDTVGPMARDVAGAVQGMDLLKAGFAAEYRRAVAARPSTRRIRIGRLYLDGTDSKVDHAVDDALAAAQFEVVKLDQAFKDQWVQAQKNATTVAAASAWLYDQKFRNELGVTLRTKAIVALGELQYKRAYRDALRRQAAWQDAVRRLLKHVDFIAVPTLPAIGRDAGVRSAGARSAKHGAGEFCRRSSARDSGSDRRPSSSAHESATCRAAPGRGGAPQCGSFDRGCPRCATKLKGRATLRARTCCCASRRYFERSTP